jgi:hypothetical protein
LPRALAVVHARTPEKADGICEEEVVVVVGVVFVSWRTAGGVASSQGGCAGCAVWREARGESDQ